MTNGHTYTQSDYNAAQVEIARLIAENEQLRQQLAEARQQIAEMSKPLFQTTLNQQEN